MSVLMTVELTVSGTDDADAVEEAMWARDGEAWGLIGDPIWGALQVAGIDAFDVATESIEYEAIP